MGRWVKQEAPLLWWAAAILLMSGVFVTFNLVETHYQGIEYRLPELLRSLPLGIGFILISIYLRRMSYRFSLLFDTLGKMYWMYLLFSVGCYAIQFTPFHLVDHSVLVFDQWLGFSSTAVYHFAMHHLWLKRIAHFCYFSISFQFYVIPLLLAFLLEKKNLRTFFIANLVSIILAYSIYYFLPTTTPAHVLPGTNFDRDQYLIVAQWYEIHLHLKNAVHIGELIGLPSYHVIWAILLTYACKNRKWLFYPMILLNVLLIASTMELGWHFLADVLGGLAVSTISIYVARHCVSSVEEKSVTVTSIATTSQLCQGFDRQSLNDDRKDNDTVSHG